MIRLSLILLVLLSIGFCKPKPPEPPPPECLPGVPWCDEVGQQCSKPGSPCKYNPTQDPSHCELAPNCPEPPPVDPCQGITCNPGFHCENGKCIEDPVPPPPSDNPCPKALAPGAYVYMNNKAYGNGFDSSPRVHGDPEFCRLVSGIVSNDCHLEGWAKRDECEYRLLDNNCPVWEYMSGDKVYLCNDDHSAIASCDHFGNPIYRDDPQTPTTGDTLENLKGFEGEPKVCGLHRDSFGPYEGFFTIAHGIGQIRACTPSRDPKVCGPWKPFNH